MPTFVVVERSVEWVHTIIRKVQAETRTDAQKMTERDTFGRTDRFVDSLASFQLGYVKPLAKDLCLGCGCEHRIAGLVYGPICQARHRRDENAKRSAQGKRDAEQQRRRERERAAPRKRRVQPFYGGGGQLSLGGGL